MAKNKIRMSSHITPLRYPGGKGKLTPYIEKILNTNGLLGCEFVEPYAGGAGVGLALLSRQCVDRIHLNEISKPVYAFWKSVLKNTDGLCRLVKDTPVCVESWDRLKQIFDHPEDQDHLTLGFATLFLNRTNFSGVLTAGMIGGRAQSGICKIAERYNVDAIIFRIKAIARMKKQITLTHSHALDLMRHKASKWDKNTFCLLDPPYFVAGPSLYCNPFSDADHAALAKVVTSVLGCHFILTYDRVDEIQRLYPTFREMIFPMPYSARGSRIVKEIMYFSPDLKIPAFSNATQPADQIQDAA